METKEEAASSFGPSDSARLQDERCFCLPLLAAPCSIRQRAEALQRGLSDDSAAVRKSCCLLLQETWLKRDCQGDLVRLLSLLDVENHEEVGQLVMKELAATDALKEILSSGASLQDFIGALQSEFQRPSTKHRFKLSGEGRQAPQAFCLTAPSDWVPIVLLCYCSQGTHMLPSSTTGLTAC